MTPVRALLSWLVLVAVAFLNGAIRQFAYPPTLGDFAARQVSTGVGAVLLGIAIWLLLRRWPIASARQAWATGALWAALTVLFEAALTRSSGSWTDVLDQYALWRGSLWPLLVLWVLVAPAALSALQRAGVAAGASLAWSTATWLLCGLTFVAGRAAFGTRVAIAIHLVAAPLIAAAATRLLWRHPRHPGVAGTALTLAAVPALLDAILVAPFLERSYEMFSSPAGTWIPLALILLASAATAAWLARWGRRELPAQAEPHPSAAGRR